MAATVLAFAVLIGIVLLGVPPGLALLGMLALFFVREALRKPAA